MVDPYRNLIPIKKCIRCEYSENKGSLHVHHLDKNRYNNTRKNLIVLCANCHTGLHQGKWRLEEIGFKTMSKQRNINTQKSTKREIREIYRELESINGIIKNVSLNKREYFTVINPKYVTHSPELRLFIKNIRILTISEYNSITRDIKNGSIRAIFDVMISTGIDYDELLQVYQCHESYNESKNTITVFRKNEARDFKGVYFFGHVLISLWSLPKIPSEIVLNRILQVYASKQNISPYGITLLSIRKSYEAWMYVNGNQEIEIHTSEGDDSLTSMRHYQGLCFSDDEIRSIKKCLTAWGF